MERTKEVFKFMIFLTMFLSVSGLGIVVCPQGYCKNGGRCAGIFLCDCSMTDFYGDRCQYTRQEIPISIYDFMTITNDTIFTTYGDIIRFFGNVTLENVGHDVSVALPSGSYLIIEDNMTRTCLDDIDSCRSGFSLKSTYSFSRLDSNATQIAMTTGAGLEEGVRGVSLYFQSGQVYCHVVTSTQQWTIAQTFTMADNELFNLTVSWHPSKGLWLLQGNDTIGSDLSPSLIRLSANESKPLLIGSSGEKSPQTVQYVTELATSPLYWEEFERCVHVIVIVMPSESTDSTTAAPTSSDDKAETIIITVSTTVGIIVAVFGILAVYFKFFKKTAYAESEKAGSQGKDATKAEPQPPYANNAEEQPPSYAESENSKDKAYAESENSQGKDPATFEPWPFDKDKDRSVDAVRFQYAERIK